MWMSLLNTENKLGGRYCSVVVKGGRYNSSLPMPLSTGDLLIETTMSKLPSDSVSYFIP